MLTLLAAEAIWVLPVLSGAAVPPACFLPGAGVSSLPDPCLVADRDEF